MLTALATSIPGDFGRIRSVGDVMRPNSRRTTAEPRLAWTTGPAEASIAVNRTPRGHLA